MVLVFFAPDLSFAGDAMGPRIGAVAYNLMHLYASGAAVALFGGLTHAPLATALGLLWIAHAGFDRALGYGLKSPEYFVITHLGRIGKTRHNAQSQHAFSAPASTSCGFFCTFYTQILAEPPSRG